MHLTFEIKSQVITCQMHERLFFIWLYNFKDKWLLGGFGRPRKMHESRSNCVARDGKVHAPNMSRLVLFAWKRLIVYALRARYRVVTNVVASECNQANILVICFLHCINVVLYTSSRDCVCSLLISAYAWLHIWDSIELQLQPDKWRDRHASSNHMCQLSAHVHTTMGDHTPPRLTRDYG